ncbi:MAG: hypothetical protein C5B60_03205 [Chloroflexi bacterium]|nr:MAG: hypothetical protein C5B60_03205 [Chloroflexota bacterium]
MTSSSESDLICANCRQPVPAQAMYCPSCGQITRLASGSYAAGSEATSAGSGPNQLGQTFWQDTTVESPPPPVPPVYGAAMMPAAADAVLISQSKNKRGTRRLFVSISLALLVAIVLGIGGYALYNVFAAHDESAAARVLPGNTYAYVSIDIVQYAENSHNFSATDLFQSGSQGQIDPIKQATGLDWRTDILPWVDRDIAVAVFPRPAPAAAAEAPGPISPVGAVILIQSKDDGAAQKAMKKAGDFQGSHGNATSQSTYSGFTLYSVNSGNGTTFTAGSGWAIIATDAATAQMVIDRVNGKGDTLDGTAAYQNATSNLASDRFGTIFVNIKEVYTAVASGAGPAANQLLGFADIYPTAGGFLEWTSAGLRAQVTLHATQNLGIGDLHGDTTSLAGLVPQNATLYAGIGNLGADALAAAKISAKLGSPGASADPLQEYLGISSNTPALQQPAAVAVLGGGGSAATSVAFLLKAPDPGAAEALVRQFASAHKLTIRPLTIAGQSGMGVYSSTGSLTAAAAVVNGSTLVVGSSTDTVAAIMDTAAGGPSLAQQSDFQKLTQNAPSDASTSLFVNLSSVQSSLSNLSQDGSIGKLLAHTTALLLTGTTNDQESQNTLDLKVNM